MAEQATVPEAADTDATGLAAYTTLRVGGPARRLVHAETEAELVATIREADAAGEPLLILGGGSNVLIGDDGFDGTVVLVQNKGIAADVAGCAGAVVTLAAGEDWDAFVAHAVAEEWSGIEALSGIPGLAGATPIQNVGAYGVEVSQTIASARTLDRTTGQFATFAAADCGFGYRSSRFKDEPGRYVVLSVTFQLPLGSLSAPVRYAELAKRLEVEVGQRVESPRVREAVLALRASKGMVLSEDDHDTWSSGSFFTNPILTTAEADRLPDGAPRFPQLDGRVKTSAAWLIDRAGFSKGHGAGPATLSTKHTLAMTNRGQARAEDVLALAREIRDGVRAKFGVELEPETIMINCTL